MNTSNNADGSNEVPSEIWDRLVRSLEDLGLLRGFHLGNDGAQAQFWAPAGSRTAMGRNQIGGAAI